MPANYAKCHMPAETQLSAVVQGTKGVLEIEDEAVLDF